MSSQEAATLKVENVRPQLNFQFGNWKLPSKGEILRFLAEGLKSLNGREVLETSIFPDGPRRGGNRIGTVDIVILNFSHHAAKTSMDFHALPKLLIMRQFEITSKFSMVCDRGAMIGNRFGNRLPLLGIGQWAR